MDPSYVSSDDEADAMAKAMGFSAFGAQGPPKKRKFNSRTDAIIDGQELASLDKGGKKGQGSGGNNIPLGKPRVFGVSHATPSNADEIDLGDDDEDQGPVYIDTSLPPPAAQSEQDEGPAYIDMSLPPPLGEAALAAQEQIDAILAGMVEIPKQKEKGKSNSKTSQAIGGLGGFLSALHEAPPVAMPTASPPPSSSVAGSMASSQRRGDVRQRNELWYVDYYDPGFNENPWKKLEEEKGWKSKGSWVERSTQYHRQGQSA